MSCPSTSAEKKKLNQMPSSVIEIDGQRLTEEEFIAKPGTTLLGALRDTLGLTAAKRGCGVGDVRHLHLPRRRPGRDELPHPGRDDQRLEDVKTLEGTTPADGGLSPLQQAFLDNFATQCGFCTPGMIMAAEALLAANPTPTREDVVTSDLRQRVPLHGLREPSSKRSLIAAEATA